MIYVVTNAKNSEGKNAKKLETVKQVFERAGLEYKFLFTEYAGHAGEICKELTADGKEITIVAMGGDGTLHEVLNGIADPEKCTLGVIPLGSGNDFATATGIALDVKYAAETVAFKSPKYVDYIELENGLRSINAVGTGVDVEVLKCAYSGKRRGKGKYFAALLKTIAKFKSFRCTVTYDGVTEEHDGIIACVGNGTQIGGGIKLFPQADISDGYLDLIVVDFVSKPKLIGALLKLVTGRVNKVKEVKLVRCKSVSITREGDYAIQAEGELYDNVPINARIVSGKLKFFLP